MKNQTVIQERNRINETSLMWLKIQGYHHNDLCDESISSKKSLERTNSYSSLNWVKRNDLLFDSSFFSNILHKLFNHFHLSKVIGVSILLVILSLFAFAGVSAQTLVASNTIQNVSCNGGSNGAIDQTITGGTAPYSYAWNNGSSTQDLSGLNAGTYTVTVMDNNGSTISSAMTINEPGSIVIWDSITNGSCSGGNDGAIQLAVNGGTPPYSYLWSNAITTQTNAGLTSGNYSVTITDDYGCTSSAVFSVSANTAPPITASSSSSTICSDSCTILFASSSNPNYVYNWTPTAVTGATVTVCPTVSTTYTVTATDPATGCTATSTVTILVTYCPPFQAYVHFANCSDNACITVTGGCPPYNFIWCNAATSNDPCFANTFLLPCQTCPVTIMDACGNSVNVTVEKPTLTLAATPATGQGICNGTATVNIGCFGCSNGDLVYTWSDGQTTKTATGLCCATTYTITVTNCYQNTWTCELTTPDCGCDTVCQDFNDNNKHGWAEDPDAPNVDVTITNSGSQGGAGDYYIRSQDQSDASALMAGPEFNVPWCCGEFCFDYKIFDNANNNNVHPIIYINGTGVNAYKRFTFVFNATVNVSSPWQRFCVPTSGPECALPPLSSVGVWTAVANTVPPTLPSDWSSVVSQIGKLTFRIDYGSQPAELSGFDNVCYTPITYQVNAGPDLTINEGQSVTLTAQGCSTTAIWHTISGNLNAGWTGQTWTVTPTVSTCYVVECGDSLCCGASDTVCITVNSTPVIHFFDGCDSTLCLNITGGTPPYSYFWHTSPIKTTCPIIVPPCTDILVTITDANGSSVTLTHKKALITGVVTNSTCNPGNGGVIFDVSCVDPTCLPLTYAWRKNGSTAVIATTKNLTGVTAGTYCVTATDACGNEYYCCYDVKCVCVWDGCIKFNTSTATLSVTTFTPPAPGCSFTYHWTTNTGFTYSGKTWKNVPAFTKVTLKVVSCCGDTVTKTFMPLCNLVLTKTDPCCKDSDGVITVSNVMGGSQPCTGYTFEWQVSNNKGGPWTTVIGATGYQLFNAKAGKWYRVIVRDCCGNFITSAPIKMGNYVPFKISAKKSTPSDCANLLNQYTGSISFKVSSNCANLTYGYSYIPFPNCPCLPPGISYAQQALPLVNNVATFTGLAPGTYTYFVQRCDTTYIFTIVLHFNLPKIKFHFTNCGDRVCIESNICCDPTYLWSNGSTSSCLTNLTPGTTYTATVTDCEGQIATRTITVPNLTATVINANCGATYGSISLAIVGSIAPFNFYKWDNDLVSWIINSNSITSGNRTPGLHCIKLFNMDGDLWECCYTISTSPAVTFESIHQNCAQTCINVLTGTPNTTGNPYHITWSPCGQQVSVHSGNCYDVCGCYDVYVTDALGCTASMQVVVAGVKISSPSSCTLCADDCGLCAPLNYLWSNGETTKCINCLTSGTYTVTVTDCNGLTYSCSQSITVDALTAQLMNVQQQLGFIDIEVKGGCLPYTCHYTLNNTSPVNQPTSGTTNPYTFKIPNLLPNDWYTVTITDACGSTVSTLQFFARTTANGIEQSNTLTTPVLSPNPNNGLFNIKFTDEWKDINVEYEIIDLSGKRVANGKIAVDASLTYHIDISKHPKGLYLVHYTTKMKSFTSKLIRQ